jgi:signal transduction histidine kinase
VAAILEVQRTGRAVEGECLLTLRSGEHTQSAEFEVAASPLQVGIHTFIVVVLHDQSATKRREALERLFYHDVANLMQGIRGWADLLALGSSPAPDTAQKLAHLTDLLDRELRSHRAMARAEQGDLQPNLRMILPQEILCDVRDLLANHALAGDRTLRLLPVPELWVQTDPELLSRVVLNMAVNAMEASSAGGTITLSVEFDAQAVRFLVHNQGEIPLAHRSQIFQRSFSTKGSPGRGLGTYAMKLFGENVLKGQVGFDTGLGGTTFWIQLAR